MLNGEKTLWNNPRIVGIVLTTWSLVYLSILCCFLCKMSIYSSKIRMSQGGQHQTIYFSWIGFFVFLKVGIEHCQSYPERLVVSFLKLQKFKSFELQFSKIRQQTDLGHFSSSIIIPNMINKELLTVVGQLLSSSFCAWTGF